MPAYKALKTLLHRGVVYRKGHVFTDGSDIYQTDIDEGRVKIANDAEIEEQSVTRPAFNPRKRGRGNPATEA